MEASQEPDWGMFVWLAMTTGASRTELCALRWNDIDLDAGVLTTTGRVVLEPQTVTLLRAYLAHCSAQAAILGIERHPGAYVFSLMPDGGTATEPGTTTERFTRTCTRLGWTMELDGLPHYSAAELVAAGADMRALNWRMQRGLSRIQRRPRA